MLEIKMTLKRVPRSLPLSCDTSTSPPRYVGIEECTRINDRTCNQALSWPLWQTTGSSFTQKWLPSYRHLPPTHTLFPRKRVHCLTQASNCPLTLPMNHLRPNCIGGGDAAALEYTNVVPWIYADGAYIFSRPQASHARMQIGNSVLLHT